MYLQELWDITSYVCKKKRWNDCPRKKNTDVLKKNDKGKHPIAPEFYRRVQAVHGSTFSEDFEISRFSVWLTSCHNPNQPVCCMKQNSIDFWLTIHLLSALFLQDTTEDIPSLEEYHSEVSGISKWVCLVWRKPTVIFPQQVTRHQNKPNTYPAFVSHHPNAVKVTSVQDRSMLLHSALPPVQKFSNIDKQMEIEPEDLLLSSFSSSRDAWSKWGARAECLFYLNWYIIEEMSRGWTGLESRFALTSALS